MKVMLWRKYVGGVQANQEAPPSMLMTEHPVRVSKVGSGQVSTYSKRRLCVCEIRILVLCDENMSTAAACKALTKEMFHTHPDATDEEP